MEDIRRIEEETQKELDEVIYCTFVWSLASINSEWDVQYYCLISFVIRLRKCVVLDILLIQCVCVCVFQMREKDPVKGSSASEDWGCAAVIVSTALSGHQWSVGIMRLSSGRCSSVRAMENALKQFASENNDEHFL